MALDIKKDEMDQAWVDRDKNDKLYKYLYDIAKHQVSCKGIRQQEWLDYIQFAVYKCFKHQNSFNIKKGAAYSFFWKQIALAIAYRSRKDARRNNKVKTFYVDQEKILDWIEGEQVKEGDSLASMVDEEEFVLIRTAYKKYNSCHRGNTLKPSRETIVKVLKWNEHNDPNFINKFSSLKMIFKNWVAAEAK